MTTVSGFSQQPYSSSHVSTASQAYNQQTISGILDQGCDVYNTNSRINKEKAALINECTLKVLKQVSNSLENKFTQVLRTSSETKKPWVCKKLPGTSKDWMNTGQNKCCIFALKNPQDTLEYIESFKKGLENVHFNFVNGSSVPEEVISSVLLDQKTQSIKPEYASLVKEVETKIDNAFKYLYTAESAALHNLFEVKKQIATANQDSHTTLESIKKNIRNFVLSEFICSAADRSHID